MSQKNFIPGSNENWFRVTCLQERIWLNEQRFAKGGHNSPIAMLVSGRLETERLQYALNAVLERNEALRAGFIESEGKIFQFVGSQLTVPLCVKDWRSLHAGQRRRRIYPEIQAEILKPFDLNFGPLVRAALFQMRDEESVLVLTVHHIVFDGWSQNILLEELAAEYAGRFPPNQHKASFFHYADAQRKRLAADESTNSKKYWEQFSIDRRSIALSYDKPPQLEQNEIGKKRFFLIDEEVTKSVKNLSSAAGVSNYVLFLAVLGIFIELRISDGDPWCLPVTVGYRDEARWHEVIGCFVEHLLVHPVARTNLPFRVYVKLISELWQRAFFHRDYPLDKLLRDNAHVGEMLAPSMVFVYQAKTAAPSIPGLEIRPLTLPEAPSKFDLTVMVSEQDDTFSLSFEFDASLYDESTIETLGQQFVELCVLLLEDSDQQVDAVMQKTKKDTVPSILVGEQHQWPDETFADLYARVSIQYAENEAVRVGNHSIKYSELKERVEVVARWLRQTTMDGILVGIHLERSLDFVVSLLAVLTEGGCYVPLAPSLSNNRLGVLLDDCAPTLVLTDAVGALRLQTLRPAIRVQDIGQPLTHATEHLKRGEPHTGQSAAYLIYTSGSTGAPNGVYGLASAILNRLRWQWETLPYMRDDRVLLRTSPMFVDSVIEILSPLLSGVCAVIASDDDLREPADLWQLLALERITHITVVPSYLESLLEVPVDSSCIALKRIHCSGEALWSSLVGQFHALFPDVMLVNIYGSTEVTADASWQIVREEACSIGRPIANAGIAIVDKVGNVLPSGVTGEIAVFGAPVGGGYRNDARSTADRYRPAPASGRMFLTGDAGRIGASGVCEYLGRLDFQVKVRGMRTNVLEIEQVLRQCTGIDDVVVLPDERDCKRLVAYYVAPTPMLKNSLVKHAHAVLPMYAVPSRWVQIGRMPRTDSGKVRRISAELEALCLPVPPSDLAQASLLEHEVIALWESVLGVRNIGLDDAFEQVGGYSLLAIRLVDKLNQRFGSSLRLAEFFAEPTVRSIAMRLEKSTQENRPLPAVLNANDVARHAPFPLQLMQQAYRVGRDAYDSASMSTICAFSMDYDELSLKDFEHAFNVIIRRHDMLRAVIVGDAAQQILADVPFYAVTVHDLSSMPDLMRQRELDQLRDAFSKIRFDSAVWPSFRIAAARIDGPRYRLFFAFDMIFVDLFSARVLMHELAAIYARDDARLPPIDISFRDYVLAMQGSERGEEYARAKAYWLARETFLAKPPQLPIAHRRPQAGASCLFKRRGFRLSAEDWASLQRFARAASVSPTSVLLSVYAATIGVWAGGDAFSLVVTLFNRQPLHPDVDKLVGDFTSSLIFGCEQLGIRTAADAFRQVQSQLQNDLDHRAYGGVELLRELTRRNGGNRVLMPVVFTSALGLPSFSAHRPSLLAGRLVDSVTQTSNVWIDNQIEEDDSALVVNWDTVDAMFPTGLIDEMFARYGRVLKALATNEAAWAAALDAIDVESLRGEVAPTDDAVAATTLDAAVLKAAQRWPRQLAIIGEDRVLTYGELLDRARHVAAFLRVERGERVGLLMDKAWDVPVAMLAVMLRGAAYVPIDPNWPEARRHAVIAAAQLSMLIVQPDLVAMAPPACKVVVIQHLECLQAPDVALSGSVPDDTAYLMFTSGTTGSPKGVVMTHRAVANTIGSVNRLFGVTDADRTLCVSSLSFDLSVYDIWGPLFCGGACVMMSGENSSRPWRWPKFIQTHGVTVWNSVPALMELLIDSGVSRAQELASLRIALLSGDWIALSMPERIRHLVPDAEIVSLGGATEAAIWSIFYPIDEVDRDWISIPYGQALPNQQVVVLDQWMRPCPVWAPGEIYIGGMGLAQGYWGDEEKTASQFVKHPKTGARLYRTGDLGCYMPSGDIRFMGRRDGQVKLNGLRVELGEIESVLQSHPLVKNAVARVGQSRQLLAYVVLATPVIDEIPDISQMLVSHAEAHLPRYMVPTAIEVIPGLPIGANGKIDRSALHDGVALISPKAGTREGSGDVLVEPVVAELWQFLLNVPQPRKQDNFFLCGGDSLIATRFAAKLNSIFRLDLTAGALYDHPTLQTLAAHVQACRSATGSLPAEPMTLALAGAPTERFNPFPLTDIQRSYHIGRRDDILLGSVAAHSYIELDYRGLDLVRFESAVNQLVERHGMLRCVFTDNGEQRVLEHVHPYVIAVDDIRGEAENHQQAHLEAKRGNASRRSYDSRVWPLFSIEATHHGDNIARVHISLDIMVADAWSTNVIARDLLAFYHGMHASLPQLEFTFRDYVLYIDSLQRSERYSRMRDYWHGRLDYLPPPPELPIRSGHDDVGEAKFTRYSSTLDAARWAKLKDASLRCGATPSAMLLAVFSGILRFASRTSSFVINVTHFNRPSIHPEINDVVGDFASTFLLEYRHQDGVPLNKAIGSLCRQILSDLDHSQYSGVKVLQDLTQRRGRVALAPVVFTSALVLPVHSGTSLNTGDLRGELAYALTQTPQVWLDHQVYQEQDNLLLAWDVRDDVFDTDLIRALFALYVSALEHLSDDTDAWHEHELPMAPNLVLECREHLARLGAERHADVSLDALIGKLSAHPAVDRVQLAASDSGVPTVVVALLDDATTRWSRGVEKTSVASLAFIDRLEWQRKWMLSRPSTADRVNLPVLCQEERAAILARRSHRRFLGERCNVQVLAQLWHAACERVATPVSQAAEVIVPTESDAISWIGSLAALRIESMPLPKFAYPSAGACYGVRAYLGVPESFARAGLVAGWHVLDPISRSLVPSRDISLKWPESVTSPVVMLAADLDRIASLYGARASVFAALEAGAMIEVLAGSSKRLGFSMHAHRLDDSVSPSNAVPLAMLTLHGDDSVSSSRDETCQVRAQVYYREGDRRHVMHIASGGRVVDSIDGVANEPDMDDQSLLIRICMQPKGEGTFHVDPNVNGRLMLGMFCQRLMVEAPSRDIGLCILGYTPAGLAHRTKEGEIDCFLVGGSLDARQHLLPQGDARMERELAATILRDYARTELNASGAHMMLSSGDTDEQSDTADEPVDLIDAVVRDIWKDVLKVSHVSGRANFFRLGGSSIDALSILRQLYDRYFIEIRLHDVLGSPTVDAMAGLLRENTQWLASIHEVHAFLEAQAACLEDAPGTT